MGGLPRAFPAFQIPVSYQTHNVDTEEKDPNSILVFFQRLLALRHTNPSLLEGGYVALNENDPKGTVGCLRRYKDKAVLVVLNVSAQGRR